MNASVRDHHGDCFCLHILDVQKMPRVHPIVSVSVSVSVSVTVRARVRARVRVSVSVSVSVKLKAGVLGRFSIIVPVLVKY